MNLISGKDNLKIKILTLILAFAVLISSVDALICTITRNKTSDDFIFNTSYEKSSYNGDGMDLNLIIVNFPFMQELLCSLTVDETEVTPNLNALGDESIAFNNYYSQNCCNTSDTEFTLFNSLYSTIDGTVNNLPAERRYNAFPSFFSALEYNTASFITGDSRIENRKEVLKSFGFQKVSDDSDTDAGTFTAAIDELENNEKSLVYIDALEQKAPYNSDNEKAFSIENKELNNYLNAAYTADLALGSFIDSLKDKGLYDKSVIVLIGAAGTLDSSSLKLADSVKELTGRDYAKDDSIRAPFIIHIPDTDNTAFYNSVSTADIMPAILDIFNIKNRNLKIYGSNPLCGNDSLIPLQDDCDRGSFIDGNTLYEIKDGNTEVMPTQTNKEALSRAECNKKSDTVINTFKENDLLLKSGLIADDTEKLNNYFSENADYSVVTTYNYTLAKADGFKPKIDLAYRAKIIDACAFDGKLEGLTFDGNAIRLSDGCNAGEYTSKPIELGELENLYTSWNSTTNGGTVEVSVCLKTKDGSYSEWYSWGVWSDCANISASKENTGRFAKMYTDTLKIRDDTDGTAIFKVKLTRGDKSPYLRNVTLLPDSEPRLEPEPSGENTLNDVPLRMQGSVPGIGGVCCSPTSLSMVLEYSGCDLPTIEVANGVKDNRSGIYGNWSFNCSYAGEKGFYSHIDLYDKDMLKYCLECGIPVACSITTASTDDLEGSSVPYASGHLIVICGYEIKDGTEYFIANDPALGRIEKVRRYYRADQFLKAWNGIVYVVQKLPETSSFRIGKGTAEEMDVITDFIESGTKGRPGTVAEKYYIVIHNTDNYDKGANAKAHNTFIHNSTYTSSTSWHYTVDDHSIYQHIPDDEVAFHAGDGGEGNGNKHGIAIEICLNSDGDFSKACENAAQLTAELLYKFDLPIENVKQHYDFSPEKKNCPSEMRNRGMWDDYIADVARRLVTLKS